VIETVADKPGLSPERRASVTQTVVCSVMAFNPRDPIEAMMAGHCVVYDHMLRDGAREMLRGQAELVMIQARPGVLAAGKIFLGTVAMLLRMQRRPEAQLAFARPLPAPDDARNLATSAPTAANDTPAVAVPTPIDRPAAEPEAALPEAVDPVVSAVAPPESGSPATASPVAGAAFTGGTPPSPPTAIPPMPEPGRESPERRLAGKVPHAMTPLMSQEMIEEILFDGIDPALRQEIIAAASLATRGGR
jgi:hypothetical protein